jgi:hypothetical protein
MIADVVLQKLGHKAIHGSPRSAHQLQNLRAIALFGKGACERFYLALDTLSPKNQIFFVLDSVTHRLYYTPYGMIFLPSIGGVGPCDVPNVVVITNSSGTEWLGNIEKTEQYRSLLEWAVECRDAGEMLVLRSEFHRCRLSPFVFRT